MRLSLPLCAAFSTRNWHERGTLIFSSVETFTFIFVREIIAVRFSVTAKGLTDAASWRTNQYLLVQKCGSSHTQAYTTFQVNVCRPTDKSGLALENVWSEWLWTGLTCFFAGEALSAVIGYHTLCGCSWAIQPVPHCVNTPYPTKL